MVVITDSLNKNIPIQYVKLQVIVIIIILQKMLYFDHYLLIIMFIFPSLSDLQFQMVVIIKESIILAFCTAVLLDTK